MLGRVLHGRCAVRYGASVSGCAVCGTEPADQVVGDVDLRFGRYAIGLRCCYVMRGTEIASGATRHAVLKKRY